MIKVIAASFGMGAQILGCEQGAKLATDYLSEKFNLKKSLVEQVVKEVPELGEKRFPYILEYMNELAGELKSTDEFPWIIGGDHSIAMGSWSGIISKHNAHKEFGLLWVDAHMDANTFESSPSKAYHGMPLAHLLGYGESALTKIADEHVKLDPRHVVLYGIRSFEEGEHELLKSLGVRIFFADEIKERGQRDCLKEAFGILKSAKKGYGVTIDLDFFDPEYAPAVGSPELNGFDPLTFASNIKMHLDNSLKALEIVEFNPSRDKNNQTLLVIELLYRLLLEDR